MLTYFNSWRRKLGVVTLLMACAFIGAWIRSLSRYEMVAVPFRPHTLVRIASSGGSVSCRIFSAESSKSESDRSSGHLSTIWASDPIGPLQPFTWNDSGCDFKWRLIGWGFDTGRGTYMSTGMTMTFLVAPYWSIASVMTLLSAFLLLSVPRTPPVQPTKS